MLHWRQLLLVVIKVARLQMKHDGKYADISYRITEILLAILMEERSGRQAD